MKFIKTLLSMVLGVNALLAQASFVPYTSDGVDFVYSSLTNLSWAANPNLPGTLLANYAAIQNGDPSGFIDEILNANNGVIEYFDHMGNLQAYNLLPIDIYDAASPDLPFGLMKWMGATAFVNYLNEIKYAGSNDWRLPKRQIDVSLLDSVEEMELWSTERFGASEWSVVYGLERLESNGHLLPTSGNLAGGSSDRFWLNDAAGVSLAYAFWDDNSFSADVYDTETTRSFVWLVTPGNLSNVPVPSTVFLMLTGLVFMFKVRLRSISHHRSRSTY